MFGRRLTTFSESNTNKCYRVGEEFRSTPEFVGLSYPIAESILE